MSTSSENTCRLCNLGKVSGWFSRKLKCPALLAGLASRKLKCPALLARDEVLKALAYQ